MRRVVRILLLAVIFVAAAGSFFYLINRGDEEEAFQVGEDRLPLIYMQEDGEWINPLFGYRKEMSAVTMRDTILPVPEDAVIHLRIDSDREPTAISYQVISLDGDSLADQGQGQLLGPAGGQAENSDGAESGGQAENSDGQGTTGYLADLHLNNNMGQGIDHILILRLSLKDGEAWYYSRLASFAEAHVSECMAFARDLHAITRDPSRQQELTGRMEPSADAEDTGLQKVTIHSSLDLICWDGFACEEMIAPLWSIQEITNSYFTYVAEYPVEHEGAQGTEYYRVFEYYRVRYGEGRLYLLDFERSLTRVYDGSLSQGADSILLGIRSDDVKTLSNQAGSVFCFVQEGDLWAYDISAGSMVRVFSFLEDPAGKAGERDLAGGLLAALSDAGLFRQDHEIRPMRVDETGSIDFAVCGYMNSGWHAGQVGISVCHYDSVSGKVSELLFLPQTMSYQQMKVNVGRVMYMSDGGKFYFSTAGSLYEADLKTGACKQVFDDVGQDFCVSDNGRYFAWTNQSAGQKADLLHVTDLETLETIDRKGGKKSWLKPLGFLGTDCLYGRASASDVKKGRAQNLFPMRTVSVLDPMDPQTDINSWEGDGLLFTGARIASEGTILLERVEKKKGGFAEAEALRIKNREMLKDGRLKVLYLDMAEGPTAIGLGFDGKVPEGAAEKSASLSTTTGRQVTDLAADVFASNYYVYAKGRVLEGIPDAAKAVRLADENAGVVVDAMQHYVWNRARMLSQNKIRLQQAGGDSAQAKALQVMLAAMGAQASDVDKRLAEGEAAFDILAEAQGDGMVLNLSGCSLDEILYYIGRGYPAYAVDGDGNPVLITGYDASSLVLFDAETGKTRSLSMQKAADSFARSGNLFYVYQRQL